MYARALRALPGPWPVRALIVLALLAGVTWLLLEHVYPWVADVVNVDPTL